MIKCQYKKRVIQKKKNESTKEREIEIKNRWKDRKNENIVERKERQQLNLFAKESEVKRAFFSKQPIIVFSCKKACLHTNELNSSLPSAIVTLLQGFDDVFLNEATIPNRPAYRSNPEETNELQR